MIRQSARLNGENTHHHHHHHSIRFPREPSQDLTLRRQRKLRQTHTLSLLTVASDCCGFVSNVSQ